MSEKIQKIIEKFVPKPQVKSCMQMIETELSQEHVEKTQEEKGLAESVSIQLDMIVGEEHVGNKDGEILDCPKENCGWNTDKKCVGMGGVLSKGQFCLTIARALRQYKP